MQKVVIIFLVLVFVVFPGPMSETGFIDGYVPESQPESQPSWMPDKADAETRLKNIESAMFDLELENLKLKMRVKNLEIIIIEQASPPGTAKSQSICLKNMGLKSTSN